MMFVSFNKIHCLETFRHYVTSYVQSFPESFSGKVQIIARGLQRPLQVKIMVYVEFAFRPVNLTRLYEDIGRLHESVAEGLRRCSATEAGVGIGAVRAYGDQPVNFLQTASGLFARIRLISDAVGLSEETPHE